MSWNGIEIGERLNERAIDLDTFVREHGPSLMGLAYTLTGSREQAEDAVQEVWTKLASRDLSDVQQLMAYARRAVINECASSGRRMTRHGRRARALEAEWSRLQDTQTDPNGRVELLSALAGLSPRQRTVVVAKYYLGIDDLETAELLGCAEATVRSLHSRAMKRLRSELHIEQGTNDED